MSRHPVTFPEPRDAAGEPVARIGGLSRAELEFLTGESYLLHGLPDGRGIRLAATTLDGRHGMVTDPADADAAARFAARIDEFSGWYRLEFERDGEEPLALHCDGYLDLTGRAARVIALMSSGRTEAALAETGALLAANPRLKYARILKYLLLSALGAGGRAIDAVREEAAHHQDEFIALRLLGDHHLERGERERARVFYRQAARVSPYNEELLLPLCEIALAQGKIDDARRFVSRLLSIRPGSEEYLALLEEARALAGTGGGTLSLEGSVDHVDPSTAAFFVRVERLFRKAAFDDVVRLVRDEFARAAGTPRRAKIASWACEVLATLPERLPPFSPPPVLRAAGTLLADLTELVPPAAGGHPDPATPAHDGAAEIDPEAAVKVARFLDAAGERYLFTLAEADLALSRAVLDRLAAAHPDHAEIACIRARAVVRQAGRGATHGTTPDAHRAPLADLTAILAADRCAAVSSYAAVSAIAQFIDRAVAQGPCAAGRAAPLLDLWDGLLAVLAAHPSFANYTPLFLLLRKWREGSGELADLALRMADRFCSFAAGPLDPASLANIARAARAARFDLPEPPAAR